MGDKGGRKAETKDQKQKAIKHDKQLKEKKDKEPRRAEKDYTGKALALPKLLTDP
ncbi:MAG: hypothetical protein MZV70_12380 [Desulfobacterales bacterium]|nr:hypothetical protein [Desulfobacterales bacterium]